MIISTRFGPVARRLAVALCLALIAGCGPTGAVKISGSGDGIGGTGVAPAVGTDGIGGTGLQAGADGIGGTGIVGVITGFGSIIVNELTVETGDAIAVQIDGKPATVAELQLGEVVEVLASEVDGRLVAQDVQAYSAVVGAPFMRSDGGLQILGQAVELNADTVIAIPGGLIPGAANQRLRISGLRRGDGVVVASRVGLASTAAPDSVTGPIARGADGSLRIGALVLEGAGPAAPIRDGAFVRVQGRLADGRLLVDSIIERSPVPFAGRATRLIVEGYATPIDGRRIRLGGIEMEVAPGLAKPRISANQRLRIEASVGKNGRVRIQRLDRRAPPAARVPDAAKASRPASATPELGVVRKPDTGRRAAVARPSGTPRAVVTARPQVRPSVRPVRRVRPKATPPTVITRPTPSVTVPRPVTPRPVTPRPVTPRPVAPRRPRTRVIP